MPLGSLVKFAADALRVAAVITVGRVAKQAYRAYQKSGAPTVGDVEPVKFLVRRDKEPEALLLFLKNRFGYESGGATPGSDPDTWYIGLLLKRRVARSEIESAVREAGFTFVRFLEA